MTQKRTRKRSLNIDKEMLVRRALDFADNDEMARTEEMNLREQRYAKFRMWRGNSSTQPWEDASDAALPDIMTDVLRVQDTLCNAVLSTRPSLVAKAINEKDEEKTRAVDRILDYQLFIENGETWLSDLIDAFVIDGHFTAFVPWVKDERKVFDVFRLGAIPEGVEPWQYFTDQLLLEFGRDAAITPTGNPTKAWDYTVEVPDEPEPIRVHFYTDENGDVEMVVERMAVRFDGPKVMVLDRSDVLHPSRAANLQIPGPSNKGGASHVIVRDRPQLAEIAESVKSGFYDLVTMSEMEEFLKTADEPEKTSEETQRDMFAGTSDESHKPQQMHGHVTRYMVFDMLDIDGDGLLEDVVYWVLREPRKIVRIRRLTEMYPGPVPMRPFAEESFVPVRGRRIGIGLPEMMEATHDLAKMTMDQAVDHGTMMLTPFGFYRPTSSMKPEVMRMFPGELYPLSDPRNDINFPVIPNAGQAYAFNTLSLLQSWNERLTMIGELQLGRVPRGKASALRTASGMGMVAQQGEARPERILRRLFNGLSQIWNLAHNLNRYFLPSDKKIRISGYLEAGEDPYMTVGRDDLDFPVQFEFSANVFNTSKFAQQEALAQIGQVILSPLAMQLGMIQPAGIYRWHHDFIKSWGHDPDKYIHSPVGGKPITWQEAVAEIMDDRLPKGVPLEGPEAHLALLEEFAQKPEFGYLGRNQVNLFFQWMQTLTAYLRQMQQMQMLARVARQSGKGEDEGEGGNPGPDAQQIPDRSQAPLEANELQDETLPGAGGGGNTEFKS